jgi:hypothetical protein
MIETEDQGGVQRSPGSQLERPGLPEHPRWVKRFYYVLLVVGVVAIAIMLLLDSPPYTIALAAIGLVFTVKGLYALHRQR